MGFNSEIDFSINIDKGLPPLGVIRRITDFSNRQECWSRIRFRIGGTTDFATTSTGWSIKEIGETAVGFSALKPKLLLL